MTEDALHVLVAEDEDALRAVLEMRLGGWGYDVTAVSNGEELLDRASATPTDVILSDIVLPGVSGLELVERLAAGGSDVPVILMTAHGSIDWAVEAMKRGASDFLTKPLDWDNLRASLEAAAAEVRSRRRSRGLRRRVTEASRGRMIGASGAMTEVFDLVDTLARSDASAIIAGESGTGKEVVARSIHEASARSGGPFVGVNAAALPESLIESEVFGHEKGAFTGATGQRPGCFELADGGTLLLDEIAEMPASLQPKLLRVLEERRARRLGGTREIDFDVRVLAATNRPLDALLRDGLLREDLFYRLNVFTVRVPPLREHPDDIPLLAQHFVDMFNEKHGTDVDGLRDATLGALEGHDWPGNVRELRNVIERATIVAREGWISVPDLPPYLRGGTTRPTDVLVLPLGIPAREAEKRLILRTLELVENNKAEAARRLELDPKTIRNKLKAWEDEEEDEEASKQRREEDGTPAS